MLDGPMTWSVFRAYVEQMLAPALRPGDVVVMDNLAAHKSLPSRRRGSPVWPKKSGLSTRA